MVFPFLENLWIEPKTNGSLEKVLFEIEKFIARNYLYKKNKYSPET